MRCLFSPRGTSIVDWTGSPRFWQHDRLILLYLGGDAGTETLLTTALGPPFARGVGGVGRPRANACAGPAPSA